MKLRLLHTGPHTEQLIINKQRRRQTALLFFYCLFVCRMFGSTPERESRGREKMRFQGKCGAVTTGTPAFLSL